MPKLGRSSRERPVDYVATCHTIADTYPDGIAHGLQKDAIQNSLDARKSKKAIVRVEFNVIENSIGRFLTFTDTNTKGLTGEVISDNDDYKNLQADDHWARFEAFAFTKSDPDALGARGQGKFIFLRASNDYKMFYDTLRADEVYRLGATQATETGCPIHPDRGEKWEDETATKELTAHCGLQPLNEIGTRIIVCDPCDEVLNEIRNGGFVAAIQETWFRAIEKKQLEVSINGKAVGLPSTCPLPDKDAKKIKTWIYKKDFDDDVVMDDFKIKTFHVAYLPDTDIPEAQQGITILQNSMKITALDMNIAPPDMREKITGFVEFDKPLDQELRKGHNQYPNHYDLKWRSKIPRAIKLFIQRQLEKFGRDKLGIGEDIQEKQKRTQDNAEKEAMKMLMRHAPALNFAGHKRTPIPPVPPIPPSPPPPPPHKDIGISMAVQFPDNNKKPRVDWGDEMRVSASCFNKTDKSISGKLAIRVLHADTLVEELTDVPIDLPGGSIGSSTVLINNSNPFVITFDETRHQKNGEYRVRAVLTNIVSGERVDVVTRRFWLNEDPPQKLPFNLEKAEWEEKRAWKPYGDINNDPTIYYNIGHPEYKQIQGDEQAEADYLLNICLDGALHFILTRPANDANDMDYSPLDTEAIVGAAPDSVPDIVHDQISLYKSGVLWSIYED